MKTRSTWLLALYLFLFLTPFALPNHVLAQDDSWETLRSRAYPKWFTDAKLGIFIHWGVYSVPAYSGPEAYAEWFLRGLQAGDSLRINFMREHYGDNFAYRDFADLWKAELFDPDEWTSLFEEAGAGYIILVSKHHDGFCLWPSHYAPGWNSMDVIGRDIVGELAEAVRARNIRLGLYYSLPEWDHPLHSWYTDPHDSIHAYVNAHMIPQFKELVEKYRPDLLFADGEWFNTADDWHARELISWYFNLKGSDAIVNDRWGEGSDIGFITPEYSSGGIDTDRPWAEVRGLGRSFGLNRNEKLEAYKTPAELIRLFMRTVAYGGGLTINVGPGADGQIPLMQQERLLELGKWIKTNHEAIYGAEKWVRSGEEREVSLERIDPQVDFNWVRNSPGYPISEDHFTAVWTGFIRPDKSGEYNFSAIADDGMRLFLDSEPVLDLWETVENGTDSEAMRDKQTNRSTRKVFLDAGKFHEIRVEYHETIQNARISLFWQSDDKEKETVPQANLYTSKNLEQGNGLQAVFRSQRQHIAYTHNHGNLYVTAFEWPDEVLSLPLPAPKPGTAVHLLGLDRELPWHYENDRFTIDISGIKYNEMPGHHAWVFRIMNFN